MACSLLTALLVAVLKNGKVPRLGATEFLLGCCPGWLLALAGLQALGSPAERIATGWRPGARSAGHAFLACCLLPGCLAVWLVPGSWLADCLSRLLAADC